MLPQRNRMNRSEFDQVFTQGRVIHGVFLYIKQAKIPASPKFSCVVSKKVAPQAVMRHLLKRRIYSIIHKEKEYRDQNYSVIIFLKKQQKSPSFQDLEKDLVAVLTASKNYKKI